MKCLMQIFVLIIAVQWCNKVTCKPVKRKHIAKSFYFDFLPLKPKQFSLAYEKTKSKIIPIEKYALKHNIKKRQIAETEIVSSVANEIKTEEGIVNEDPLKISIPQPLEKTEVIEAEKPAEVIITSVVEPIEPGKQISFLLPVDSEVVITPAAKEIEKPPVIFASEVSENPVPVLKPELVTPLPGVIVDITPKPIELPPPPVITPIEPNVALTTSIESTVLPYLRIPVFQDANSPGIGPVINNVPVTPFLYTNLKPIPFYTPGNVVPFITPSGVPIPEVFIPPRPPTIVKDNPPVVKEEQPNFFVKSSRYVLYFGSMMLQMLSQLVNGRVNFNQIPLQFQIPGVQ